MRARAECGVAIVLAVAAASACDSASGPLDLHPDVVVIEVLLVAGESEARMLAVHPHRGAGDGAPEIDARVVGPGWEAAFSETLRLEDCTDFHRFPGTKRCLRASLPEPVRAGGLYGLAGTGPLGAFTGETRVPDPPLLLTDTLHLSWPDGGEWLEIPLRYRAGSGIGTLAVDVRNVFEIREDGTEVELNAGDLRLAPWFVDPAATADTVSIRVRERPLRFSLPLLGIGWRWTDFTGVEGLEGEGVYGYFDGVAPSRPALILVGAAGSSAD